MALLQQGDVALAQTVDGGDIESVDGVVTMSGGLEVAAYLSLFGGNEDDDGTDDNPFTFWANLNEIDPTRRYVSETQNLLYRVPLTTVVLRRVEDAATRDLQWFLDSNTANVLEVTASIPALNTIQLDVRIEAFGIEENFQFVENWKASTGTFTPPAGSVELPFVEGFILLEDGGDIITEDGLGRLFLE